MNVWGVDGCREHFDEIVVWLVENAKVTRVIAGSMVTRAIKSAED